MFRGIKENCYDQFLAAKKKGKKFNFTADKLANYKKGFNKHFYNVATINHGVPIKCKKYKLKKNNNCIERDHQYSRKLEKNGRGHKSFEGANALFDLGDVYYNFIDKQKLMNEEIWRTPAERTKIRIKIFVGFHSLTSMHGSSYSAISARIRQVLIVRVNVEVVVQVKPHKHSLLFCITTTASYFLIKST